MLNKTNFFILVWALFVFACAAMSPYFSNDYRYMLIEGTNDLVTNFSDIVLSQWRHYFDWGGRTPDHVLAQWLLLIGKPYSAVFTGIGYALLIMLIYCHGFGNRLSFHNLRLAPVAFIALGLWLCLREYGEVVFMLVTSCNYFFTTILILGFLLPYRLTFNCGYQRKDSVFFTVLMFIVGILAGWCNENTGFAVSLGIGAVCLYDLIKKQLTFWEFFGGLGFAIGYLLLVLSPGNAARLDYMKAGGDFDYFEHIFSALKVFGLSLLTQLPLLIAFLFMLFKVKSDCFQIGRANRWYASLWLFAIGFLSLFIMVFSPNFPARSAAPFTVFIIASILALYKYYEEREMRVLSPFVFRIFSIVAVCYCVTSMANTAYGYYQLHQDQKVRTAEIDSQLKEGSRALIVHPFNVKTNKYIFVSDVRAAKNYWVNNIVKRYYNVESIRRTCNYEKSFWAFDFLPYTQVGRPVCEGDRGDPEDPRDPLNIEYLRTHKEEIKSLKFADEAEKAEFEKALSGEQNSAEEKK